MEDLVVVLEEVEHLEEGDLAEDVVGLEEIRLDALETEETASGMMKEELLVVVVVLMVLVVLEDSDQEAEDSLEDLVEEHLEVEMIRMERRRRHKSRYINPWPELSWDPEVSEYAASVPSPVPTLRSGRPTTTTSG